MNALLPARRIVVVFMFVLLLVLSLSVDSHIVDAQTAPLFPEVLPNGSIGIPYSATFFTSQGNYYSYAVSSGSLPLGLFLDAETGVLHGIPTEAGDFTFRVTVASNGTRGYATGQRSYTVNIASVPISLSLIPSEITPLYRGHPYRQLFTVEGGVPPYRFEIANGVLPQGLSLNVDNGLLSGSNLTNTDFFNFLIRVTDSVGNIGLRAYELRTPSGLAGSFHLLSFFPNAEMGMPYSGIIMPPGGSPPYDFVVTKGAIPAGLALDPATGAITGTPTAVGKYYFTITGTDAYGYFQDHNAAIEVITESHNFHLSSVPGTQIYHRAGRLLWMYLQTTGGTHPVTFSVARNSLPPNVSLDSTTGIIRGTPTQTGVYYPVILATDALGRKSELLIQYIIRQNTLLPMTLTPATLPIGTVGAGYHAQLTIDGIFPAEVYQDVERNLPPGLTLDWQRGIISGTPTLAGNFTFQIQAFHALANWVSRTYTVLVMPSNEQLDINVTPSTSTSGAGYAYVTINGGVPFSATVNAQNGTPPYSYQLVGGALPMGLMLSLDGTIDGTTYLPLNYFAQVEATDSNGRKGTRDLFFSTILGTLDAPVTALPGATVGSEYHQPTFIPDGRAPYTYYALDGFLPSGVTLDSVSGNLIGTPTSAGSFRFGIMVSDTNGSLRFEEFTLQVAPQPPLALEASVLPSAIVNSSYTYQFNVSGGTRPYAFLVRNGVLPPGIQLLPNGTISGMPAQPGIFEFTLQVTDAIRTWVSQPYVLTVNQATEFTQPLTFSPAPLPVANVGMPYQALLAVQGGTPPYSFVFLNGTLPPGFGIDGASGLVSGIAADIGSYTFSVQAIDSTGNSGIGTFTLTVAPPDALGGH